MDKVLLTAFLSALAGFITAILSIVKLVNEKESKTTDYRQAWTESVRTAFANLIANINSQAAQINAAATLREMLGKQNAGNGKGENERFLAFNEARLKDLQEKSSETRRHIYESYASVRLHFKPNDLSFNRVEQKFDSAITLINSIQDQNEAHERAAIKERVNAISDEITGFARDILKTEWETVKKGEPAYRKTKKWSVTTSIVMLFILISIGVHAGISIRNESIKKEEVTQQSNSN